MTLRPSRLRRRSSGFLLAGLTLAALGLRLFNLDFRSIWLDEAYSLVLAQSDFAGVVQGAAMDIHPPLFHLLLGGWIRLFGTSEFAARSLGALLGALLVPVAFLLADAAVHRRGAWWTAGLVAVSPYFLEISRTARMAPLLALTAALGCWAFLRLLATGRVRYGFAYTAAMLAAIYTHYFAFLVVFAIYLYLFMGMKSFALSRAWRRHWFFFQILLLAGFAPWLEIFVGHVTQGGPAWRGVGAAWWEPLRSLHHFTLGTSCWQMWHKVAAWGLLAAAAAVVSAWCVPRFRTLYASLAPHRWGFLLTLTGVPLMLVWIYSVSRLNVFDDRYLSVPALGAVASFGLILFMQPLSQVVGLALMLATAGWYAYYARDVRLRAAL